MFLNISYLQYDKLKFALTRFNNHFNQEHNYLFHILSRFIKVNFSIYIDIINDKERESIQSAIKWFLDNTDDDYKEDEDLQNIYDILIEPIG